MENQQQTTTLCRAGCGFFGSPATEGLCSKCFKDQIKRKQDTASRLSPTTAIAPSSAANTSASAAQIQASASGSAVPSTQAVAPPTTAIDSPTTSAIHINDKVRDVVTCSQAAKSSEQVTAQLESAVAAAAASVEAAGGASSSGDLSNSSSVASLETAADGTTDAANVAPAPKKPNRCQVCKKRVGLTGFVCRCGGLYCGEHRYDSAHGCSFDYKTMEREELRKNNPVIVSEKIQRI